jgi:N-acetyl-gamma-glutamyl-phosphate reductase
MKIAIIGASGYAGGELIRLLVHHSTAKVTVATSRKLAGKGLPISHLKTRILTLLMQMLHFSQFLTLLQ